MTLLIGLMTATGGAPAASQISPGELSASHSSLEGISHCERCHDPGGGPISDQCLDCHREIKVQLDELKGLHGMIRKRESQVPCELCHAEHNGREFELIYWKDGIEAFDHVQTGFLLQGKHARTGCRECHRRALVVKDLKALYPGLNLDRTYLGLLRDCASCHPDAHRAQFSGACDRCHGLESWRPALLFSHDRSRYPLKGKHVRVPCGKCHPAVDAGNGQGEPRSYTRYVGLKYDDCSACHTYRHRTELGKRCDGCHTPDQWQTVSTEGFDHQKTRYPLKGRHRTAPCTSCHRERTRSAPLRFERCVDCHRDIHRDGFRSERFVGRCELCHGEDRFLPSTYGIREHDESPYPLTGAHRAIPCTACHKGGKSTERISFRLESRTCDSCHRDPHRGQFREAGMELACSSCHSTSRWGEAAFDHQKTAFPLDGRHIGVRCGACHPTVVDDSGQPFTRYKPLDRSCRGCHATPFQGESRD